MSDTREDRLHRNGAGEKKVRKKKKGWREMTFKKLRGVNRSYTDQGLIYFTCQTYAKQPKAVQEKIKRLCKECGGPYEEELFVMMTRQVSWEWIETEYHVSAPTMYRAKKRFFERW